MLIDEPVARGHLEELRRSGLLISIDDFGTGYNSISRLETIPADVVKVDKRFVDVGSTSAKLLPLMIQSAHAFGLPVVAEGVETSEQLAVLRVLGCEMAQGFFLARPMDAATAGRVAGRFRTLPAGPDVTEISCHSFRLAPDLPTMIFSSAYRTVSRGSRGRDRLTARCNSIAFLFARHTSLLQRVADVVGPAR